MHFFGYFEMKNFRLQNSVTFVLTDEELFQFMKL
jgi:hypothetical protein